MSKATTYLLFFKQLGLLLLILLILDRSIGYVLKVAYDREPQGENSVTTHLLNTCKSDVLIFGSSRASHHYDASFLEKSLHHSVFNGGRDGINVIYSNAILPVIFNRYSPKLIVLDVKLDELSWKAGVQGKEILSSILLPYVDKYPEIATTLKSVAPMEFYKSKISMLYRYNSLPLSLLQHHVHIGEKNVLGYLPLNGSTLNQAAPEFVADSVVSPDPFIEQSFESFIHQCQQHHCKLVLLISPRFGNLQLGSNKLKIQEIAKKYHVELYDYSQHDQFKNPALFHDVDHMNQEGVRLYNNLILDKLSVD